MDGLTLYGCFAYFLYRVETVIILFHQLIIRIHTVAQNIVFSNAYICVKHTKYGIDIEICLANMHY